MKGLRLVYLYPWRDYESEFRRKTPEQLKTYVCQRLETLTKYERRWIVIIAGIGFFADAYAIFAINLVVPMLGVVYWQGAMPPNIQIGLTTATLGGSMLGQLLFGFAADWLGRRKTYGWELIVTIVATIGVASASSGISGVIPPSVIYNANKTYPSNGNYNKTGFYYDSATYTANGIDPWNGSLSIIGGLIAWRLVLGLAIGADYPLSAVICSEFAPKKHRARMLSAVFLFQPLGQLAATLIALIVTVICGNTLGHYDQTHCYQYPGCLRTVDIMWRVIIGFGTVLPAIAMGFRFAILESPRYLADVRNKGVKAAAQLNSMGQDSLMQNQSSPDDVGEEASNYDSRNGSHPVQVSGRSEGAPGNQPFLRTVGTGEIQAALPLGQHETATSNGHVMPVATDRDRRSNVQLVVNASAMENEAGALSRLRVDIKKYYRDQGHGWTLFATSLCWFCVDLPFYGLGMNSTSIISQIWVDEGQRETNLYSIFLSNTWESLIFVSIGATIGGFITFFTIRYLGERTIQMIGFAGLFILFIITGSLLKHLMDEMQDKVIIFLYVMCQIFFNFGPNTTTYVIAAEFFPTRFRASSHGISAASGKLGSVIAQAIIYGIYINKPPYDIQDWLGWTLLGFSPLMLIGLLATVFLIPKTNGQDGKPLSLEQLAGEHQSPDNMLLRMLKRRSNNNIQSNGVINGQNGAGNGDAITMVQDHLTSKGPPRNNEYEMAQVGMAL